MPTLIDPNALAPRPVTAQRASLTKEEGEAIALAQNPPPKSQRSRSLLVLLSLEAFVVLAQGARTTAERALLNAVLFLHEGGHIVGMRLFGFRDLDMLFVPFVGALASGTKNNAPEWQHAIVLHLGPLPGLIV